MHSALYESSDENHKLLSTSFQLQRSAITSISDVLMKPEHGQEDRIDYWKSGISHMGDTAGHAAGR